MTYEFIAFWLLIAIGVVRLVTMGAGTPRPREEEEDLYEAAYGDWPHSSMEK